MALTVERLGVIVPIGSDDEAAAALRALVDAGLRVVEFAPATGTLEHTLLDLRDGSPT